MIDPPPVQRWEWGVSDTSWYAQAACRGKTLLFYSDTEASRMLAQAVCLGCPVRQECLEDARATEVSWQRFGVRGGLTAKQRRQRWD